jgi:hypothetical protein
MQPATALISNFQETPAAITIRYHRRFIACFTRVLPGLNTGSGAYLDTVIVLSGQTRGATLEGIGRSFGKAFQRLGLSLIEISLTDSAAFLETINSIDFRRVVLVFSFASMGMEISLRRANGTVFDLWQEMGVPFLSIHGDSPAYFFDRHIVKDSRFVSIYIFPEHRELRARLPQVNGPLQTSWLMPLDEVPKDRIDFAQKVKYGRLLFLKNGKNPMQLQQFWRNSLDPRLLRPMQAMASVLEKDLDNPAGNHIDDLFLHYFAENNIDVQAFTRLRLFFIAQMDDYLRALKCTRMVEALMDFPVEIHGNDWGHIDFSGGQATYIDDCDFVKSTELIRRSLAMIDMSPNTASHPHDRVMRAYGAHTACLTNRQAFQDALPHQQHLGFVFQKDVLQQKIAYLLDHRSEVVEMGIEVADAYRASHPEEETVRQLLDCAALVRFNNLHQRPDGSQEYFGWSQQLP